MFNNELLKEVNLFWIKTNLDLPPHKQKYSHLVI